MLSPKVRFQQILRDLFRLNCADLDFGWYNVINQIRPSLENFIEEDVDRIIGTAISQFSLESHAADAIYTHLVAFFEQCTRWEVPSRREKTQGKENGVLGGAIFSWNDFNQYYGITNNAERRFQVKINGWQVCICQGKFTIKLGNVDKNTYFWVPAELPIHINDEKKEIDLNLEFRPLTPAEQDRCTGFRNKQEEIFSEVSLAVCKAIPSMSSAKTLEEIKNKLNFVQVLQFYSNLGNKDNFIHRELSTFVSRKWQDYITHSFLQLPNVIKERDDILGSLLQERSHLIHAATIVMQEISAILISLENIQRDTYLMPKRIKREEFCVPWYRVPEKLCDAVLANADQLAEWKTLYKLIPANAKDVAPQTLIDTKFFDAEFLRQLFRSNKEIQASPAGLAISGDNFQALLFLRENYKNRVKMIYIDPPYNKGNSEFLYRDSYRPEAWGILMRNVLELARDLLREDGMIFVSIDDNRVHELALLLKEIFGAETHIATMPVKSNPRGRSMERFVATSHEYLLFFAKDPNKLRVADDALTPKQVGEYNKEDPKLGPYRLLELRNRNPQFARHNRPNLFYPIYFNPDSGEFGLDPFPSAEKILPRNTEGKDGVWRWSKEKFLANKDRIVIKRVKRVENPYNIYKKDFLYKDTSGKLRQTKHKTFLEDNSFNYQNGKRAFREMFGETLFGNPKPLALIDKCLDIADTGEECIVLDFFAGSGTTGHAVVERMRQKGDRYQYILVEIGQIFYDALLPRLKKASYASRWSKGAPLDQNGAPHVIRYLELESYEEILNRLLVKSTQPGAFEWRL